VKTAVCFVTWYFVLLKICKFQLSLTLWPQSRINSVADATTPMLITVSRLYTKQARDHKYHSMMSVTVLGAVLWSTVTDKEWPYLERYN
jgi:hypothetical protein